MTNKIPKIIHYIWVGGERKKRSSEKMYRKLEEILSRLQNKRVE